MQRDPPGPLDSKPTKRRRRTLVVLAFLVVFASAVFLVVRARMDDWMRLALERGARDKLGGELSFGEFRLRPLRLAVDFSELSFESGGEVAVPLRVTVASGRARLAWSTLPGLAGGRVRLAELDLEQPVLETERGPRAPPRRSTRRRPPFEWRIDRFEATGGRFVFEDREIPMHLAAEDVLLEGNWDAEQNALVARTELRLEFLREPLVRPLPLRVSSGIRLRRHDVEFFGLEADGAGVSLSMDGTVRLTGTLTAAGRGQLEADMDRLRPLLDPKLPLIAGQASGPFGWEYGPDPLRVRGRVAATHPRFGRFAAASAAANVRYTPGRLELRDLEADVFDGEVRGGVELAWADTTRFRVALDGARIDSAPMLEWLELPLPMASRVALRMELGGVTSQRSTWEGRGSFSAVAVSAPGAGLATDAVGEIELAGGRLGLRSSDLRLAGAVLGLELGVDVEAQPMTGSIRLEGRTLDAARTQAGTLLVLERLGIDVPGFLRQSLSGQGTIDGRIGLGRPELELELRLEAGGFGLQAFDRAELEVRLDREELSIDRLQLRRGEAQLRGSGQLTTDPFSVSHLVLETEKLDPRWLLDLAELDVDLEGWLDASVDIRQDAHGRTGFGRLMLTQGRWLGEPFDEFSAELEIGRDYVRLDNALLRSPAGQLAGNMVWHPSDALGLLDVHKGSLHLEALEAVRSRGFPLEGLLGLEGRIRFDAGELHGQLQVAGEDWRVAERLIGAVHGRAELRTDALGFRLAGDEEAGWAVTGRVGWADRLPLEVRIELDDTPLELVPEAPGTWSGRLTGELTVEGHLREPEALRAWGIVEHAELRRGARELATSEPIRLDLNRQQLAVAPIRVVGRDTDVAARLWYDAARDELDATAEGHADLGVLTAGLPEVRASGPVELEVEARGPLRQPSVRGTLQGTSGRLRVLGFPQSLDGLSFRIDLDRQDATLHALRARFGNGEISASGSARLSGFAVESYEIQADAANVRAVYPAGFRGIYEGRVYLRGSPGLATLGGRLRMLRGLYDRKMDVGQLVAQGGRPAAPLESSLPQNVDLDLTLVADGNVWVRNDLAQIESTFDLHLGGSLRRPQLTGRLWMLEGGELWFRNVEYRLQSGSLDFLDVERINPYLTLRAETEVKDYKVFLRVEGTLDRFEYELTSEPTLSTQDIIALLTTGNTLEEITAQSEGSAPFTGDLAANYFAGALTGPFEKQLERLLGLERVSINPLLIEGEADPTTRITLGEEVADDLLLIFSTDVGKTERQLYQVNWQATRKFRLIAERDTQGGIGGDLRYTDRFWLGHRPDSTDPVPVSGAVRDADSSPPARLSSIRIRGAAEPDLAELRRQIGLNVGDLYSRSAMFKGVEALKRFYVRHDRIGTRVDAVAASVGTEVHVSYDIDPGPPAVVTFVGTSKKEQRRLRPMLRELWIESVFSEDLYQDSVEAIRGFFQKRGHYAVDVQYSVETREDRRYVTFDVDRGMPVRVERVILNGVEQVSEEQLRGQMLTRPSSMFSRRVLVPDVLSEDVAAIRAFYRNEGFLQASVARPQIHLSTSSESAVVELSITEGPGFTVAAVHFPDDVPFSTAEMRAWAGVELDQVFSPAGLLKAESRLRAGIDERGYPDARVRGEAELGDSVVEVRFAVEPGEFKRVAEVSIRGNKLTQEKVIRRELELGPGEPISREQVLRSQHQLYQLGIFRNVRLAYEATDPGRPEEYRLEVAVEEAPPLSTSIGAGYDSEARAGFSFSLTHDNLGGYDRTLSVQGKYSGLEKRLQLVGKEPRLFGHKLSALLTLGWSEEEEVDFTVAGPTVAARVDRRFNAKWSGFLRYSFQRVDLSDVMITPDELQEEKLVEGRLGDAGLAFVRDTRDNPFMTRTGTYLTAGVRVFARPLLSEFTFVKTTATGSLTRPVGAGASFASSVRLGLAWPFGPEGAVPISEAFFAGGDTTIRGFPRDEVGPASGGEALFILNEEVRFPIWRALKGVAFYDAGNVYAQAADVDLTDLRHVLGLGLRLETPIGPLRLEYGWKLDREPDESRGELFLAIGSAF